MNNNNINKGLFDFIGASPTAFHSVANAAKMLEAAGFSELCESGEWQLSAGEGYYVTRNGSSLIAFRFPEGDFNGYMMTAAHGDSPAFRIKENALLDGKDYVRIFDRKIRRNALLELDGSPAVGRGPHNCAHCRRH